MSSLRNNDFGSRAFKESSRENYLGDINVVGQILRSEIADVLAQPDGSRMVRTAAAAAQSLAKTFLGRNSEFAAMSNWNADGFINKFVERETTVGTGTALSVMERYFLAMFSEFISIASKDEPDWKEQADNALDGYVATLLGIPQ